MRDVGLVVGRDEPRWRSGSGGCAGRLLVLGVLGARGVSRPPAATNPDASAVAAPMNAARVLSSSVSSNPALNKNTAPALVRTRSPRPTRVLAGGAAVPLLRPGDGDGMCPGAHTAGGGGAACVATGELMRAELLSGSTHGGSRGRLAGPDELLGTAMSPTTASSAPTMTTVWSSVGEGSAVEHHVPIIPAPSSSTSVAGTKTHCAGADTRFRGLDQRDQELAVGPLEVVLAARRPSRGTWALGRAAAVRLHRGRIRPDRGSGPAVAPGAVRVRWSLNHRTMAAVGAEAPEVFGERGVWMRTYRRRPPAFAG